MMNQKYNDIRRIADELQTVLNIQCDMLKSYLQEAFERQAEYRLTGVILDIDEAEPKGVDYESQFPVTIGIPQEYGRMAEMMVIAVGKDDKDGGYWVDGINTDDYDEQLHHTITSADNDTLEQLVEFINQVTVKAEHKSSREVTL